MSSKPEALVYVDGFFHCADGKVAHGLVRYSNRYHIAGVIDSTMPQGDAGELMDGVHRGIPMFSTLEEAYQQTNAEIGIIGAVSDGGVLPKEYDKAVIWMLSKGLDIVSGLHDFLSDNHRFQSVAIKHHGTIIDVRKIFRDLKRFYSGDICHVKSKRIALLGTDSAVGKRTLAVFLTEELKRRGRLCDMIFTGQTGWLQGWPHGIVLDAMINDFIAGGLEGAILESWKDLHPEFMLIEGQGSLVHPFFPGGFEILAAGRVDGFLLVDAPGRKHFDGFPGYPMPDPGRVVKIAEILSEKPLLGIGINREGIQQEEIEQACHQLQRRFHVPVGEPILQGVSMLADALEELDE